MSSPNAFPEHFNLDRFVASPALQGEALITPPAAHRRLVSVGFGVAAVVAALGAALIGIVQSHADHPAADTVWMGLGLLLFVAGLGGLVRFAQPLTFAVVVTQSGVARRGLFGWRLLAWEDIRALVIEPSSRFGGREAIIRTEKQVLHYGWAEPGESALFAPIERLEAADAHQLTHTIQTRANLTRKEHGLWLSEGCDPKLAWSGKFNW
jgi:Bacterial PH domain